MGAGDAGGRHQIGVAGEPALGVAASKMPLARLLSCGHARSWAAPRSKQPKALNRGCMRVADAASVAEGVALGLLLNWAERAPPSDDLPPRVGARRASDDDTPVFADH